MSMNEHHINQTSIQPLETGLNINIFLPTLLWWCSSLLTKATVLMRERAGKAGLEQVNYRRHPTLIARALMRTPAQGELRPGMAIDRLQKFMVKFKEVQQ